MLHLYQTVIAHRSILRAIMMVAIIAAMALGISADAAAGDGEGADP